jgi:hypothetical protein
MSTRRIAMGGCAVILLTGVRTISADPSKARATKSAAATSDLFPSEARAKAVGYVLDTRAADNLKYPRHTSGQSCAACQRYAPASGKSGTCNYFGGATTPSNAWCSAFCPQGAQIDSGDRSCKW